MSFLFNYIMYLLNYTKNLKGYRMKVFTTGTFDLLHYGHINLLKRAKALGDYLVVGLNAKPEGKTPINSPEERKYINAIGGRSGNLHIHRIVDHLLAAIRDIHAI